MDEAQWKQHERQIAQIECLKVHPDVFRSTVGSDGMTKTADVPCHFCLEFAAKRVAKEQKAQGVEITGQDEIEQTLKEFGLDAETLAREHGREPEDTIPDSDENSPANVPEMS